MAGWIDGWMDRWMDGWIDGRMAGWMDGWTELAAVAAQYGSLTTQAPMLGAKVRP